MQKLMGNVEYFKSICHAIDASTTALEERAEPFCILSLIYEKGVPNDIVVLGCNKAFRETVNDIAIGLSIRAVSQRAVDFWLNALVVVENTDTEVIQRNYTVHGGHVTYGKVTVFPIKLLGKIAVGMILEEPIKVKNGLCLRCPNNPTVKEPSLKMGVIAVSEPELSACEVCQLARSLSPLNDA